MRTGYDNTCKYFKVHLMCTEYKIYVVINDNKWDKLAKSLPAYMFFLLTCSSRKSFQKDLGLT